MVWSPRRQAVSHHQTKPVVSGQSHMRNKKQYFHTTPHNSTKCHLQLNQELLRCQGTIMVSECRVGRWKSHGAVPGLRREAYLKRRGKKADVNGLLTTRVQNRCLGLGCCQRSSLLGGGGCSEIAKGPVLISESPSATVGHVKTCGLGRHLGPCW